MEAKLYLGHINMDDLKVKMFKKMIIDRDETIKDVLYRLIEKEITDYYGKTE